MYYLNTFYIYSVIGFIIESTMYKLMDSNRHSGIFYGPITPIYGIGVLIILFLYKMIYEKLNINKYLKPILLFISSIILLTLIEWIGGHLINTIFSVDLWDYSNKNYNFGKYICLEVSLCWGLLSLVYVYIVKPFLDRFIKRIPKLATIIFTLVFIIDLIAIFVTKRF